MGVHLEKASSKLRIRYIGKKVRGQDGFGVTYGGRVADVTVDEHCVVWLKVLTREITDSVWHYVFLKQTGCSFM
jgi:hypothetical protein